jgi:hypothetical protein
VYATVRTYSGNTALADALVANESDVKALISGIDGFKAYYLVRTADGTASVSVFEDEAGAAASNAAAAAFLRENVADVAGDPPQVHAGEVAISF